MTTTKCPYCKVGNVDAQGRCDNCRWASLWENVDREEHPESYEGEATR